MHANVRDVFLRHPVFFFEMTVLQNPASVAEPENAGISACYDELSTDCRVLLRQACAADQAYRRYHRCSDALIYSKAT